MSVTELVTKGTQKPNPSNKWCEVVAVMSKFMSHVQKKISKMLAYKKTFGHSRHVLNVDVKGCFPNSCSGYVN
jgi:hypothetical protein